MPNLVPSSFGNAVIGAIGVIVVGFLLRIGWEVGGSFCSWIT